MTVRRQEQFDPDPCEPPGASVRDWMNENGLSLTEAAQACQMTAGKLLGLLDGQVLITHRIAGQLAHATGTSVQFWINRERNYRQALQNQTNKDL